MHSTRVRFSLAVVFSLLILLCLLLLSLSYGTVDISFAEIYQFFSPKRSDLSEITQLIISEVRTPRYLLAVLVGAGLAMVGSLLQTVTKNYLADPFLFGLSSGASAGAVVVITRFGSTLGYWALPIAAFVGGIVSALAVIVLFSLQRNKGIDRLILSGLAVSFIFSAVTSYLIYAGDQRSASTILFWSMGGLGLARWDNLIFALLGVLLLVALTFFRWRSLDAMLVDEETCNSLGVRVKHLRILVFISSALATSAFVSLTGVIGFVGLVVPHLAKPFAGVSHRYLIPLCALFGAIVLAASDLVSRTIVHNQELPVGLVTSAIGGFFVLLFVLRQP